MALKLLRINYYVKNLTPNIIIEAPDNVAVCPPLGVGPTPSIKGFAHCHFRTFDSSSAVNKNGV